MAIFKQRFASQEITQIFVYCAFPIHVWTIINMLRDVPSWAIYMRSGELISAVAYTLSFALFETLTVFLLVILIGLIVPKHWIKDKFVPMSSVLLIELALMAIVLQFFIKSYLPKRILLLSYTAIIGLSIIVVPKFPKIKVLVSSLAKRLSLLTFIYIFTDIIGLLIVIARNI